MLRSDELGELLNPFRYHLCGPVLSCQGFGRVRARFDVVRHDGGDQIGPPGEVAVHRADADACSISDLLSWSVDARFRKDGLCRHLRLGTLMFATQMGSTDAESAQIIHKALDAGINLVDTADGYGDSEEIVGRALKGRRDNVVLATKFTRPMGTDPNQQGASRRWIVTAVENSLRRLQTDHIDLYQLHRPDPETDIEETLSALTDLVRSGKIRAFGTSTMPASNLVEAHWVAERRGLERFRSEQPPYSILNRGIEREVLPVAQQFGMGILVWGPLGQGMLTGRVRRGQDTDVIRSKFLAAFRDERRLDAVEQLIPLAEDAGLSMAHLAMAFAISHPGVTSALLGARTMQQLDDLLAGVDTILSDDVLDRIDEIVPPGVDIGTLDQAYVPPALAATQLRRRPLSERSAG